MIFSIKQFFLSTISMISPIEQFKIFPVYILSNLSFFLLLMYISLILFEKNKFLFQKHLEW